MSDEALPAWGQEEPRTPQAQRLDYAGSGGGGLPTLSQRGLEAAAGMRPWLILFAVLMFIGVGFGVLGLLGLLVVGVVSLVGGGSEAVAGGIGMIVVAVLYAVPLALTFFPALFLTRCAGAIGRLRQGRRGQDLDELLVQMKAYWKFLGIVFLVGVGVYVLMFVALLVLGVALGS